MKNHRQNHVKNGRITIQHASISNSPPQESYPANPLVLSYINEVIACVQHTIALSKVRNVRNGSHP